MSIINDNLINSIIRLRVSLELGLISEQIQNTNSIFNRMHRNNIFYNIVTSEINENINNLYNEVSTYTDENYDSSNFDNDVENTPNIYSNYQHINTETFIPPRIINDMSGFLVANILSSILDPYSNYNDLEEEIPILTEDEFNMLSFTNIDKDHPLLTSQCSICLDDFKLGEISVTLKCKHVYHKECIKNWLIKQSSKCPTCRMCCKENL